MPPPRAGDARIAYLDAALDGDFSKFRDRRGRRGPSVAEVIRKQLGPKTLPLLKSSLPRAMALLDGTAATLASGRPTAGAHLAQFTPTPDGFSYTVGDVQLDVRITLAGQLAAEFALTQTSNGKRVRTTVRPFKDSSFAAPLCPDDKGVMDAKDGIKIAITVETLDIHDRVDQYFTQSVVQSTTVSALIKRKTKIRMRTEPPSYDPAESSVTGDSSVSGLLRLFQGQFQAAAVARLKRAADEGFAKTVDKAVEDYRGRESGWNIPNQCVKITYAPASNTMKLRSGQSGNFSATLAGEEAPDAEGKWTLTGSSGGSLSPAAGQGHQLPVSYTVGGGGGTAVTARYKAVGRSGIAEGTWTQPTENEPPVRRIGGNFTGTAAVQGATYRWNGGATFTHNPLPPSAAAGLYRLTAGNVTYHAGGNAGAYGYNCTMSGSRNINLPYGSMTVAGSPPMGLKPYSYDIHVPVPPSESTIDVTLSSCADPQADGTVITVGIGGYPIDTGDESFTSLDGLDYRGHHGDGNNGGVYSVDWTMLGDTNP